MNSTRPILGEAVLRIGSPKSIRVNPEDDVQFRCEPRIAKSILVEQTNLIVFIKVFVNKLTISLWLTIIANVVNLAGKERLKFLKST